MARFVPQSETLGRGLVAWLGRLGPVALLVVPLAAAVYFGIELLDQALPADALGHTAGAGADDFTRRDALLAALMMLGVLLGGIPVAALVHGALDDRPLPLRAALRLLARRAPATMLATLLVAAPMLAMPFLIETAVALGERERLDDGLVVMALLGGVPLLVLPWLLPLGLAPQVALHEGLGPLAALRRSAQLTRGERMAILGSLLSVGFVLGGLTLLAAAPLSHADLPTAQEELIEPVWLVVLLTVYMAVLGSVAATIHHDLRARRESTGFDELIELLE